MKIFDIAKDNEGARPMHCGQRPNAGGPMEHRRRREAVHCQIEITIIIAHLAFGHKFPIMEMPGKFAQHFLCAASQVITSSELMAVNDGEDRKLVR